MKNMHTLISGSAVILTLFCLAGCGGAKGGGAASGKDAKYDADGRVVLTEQAKQDFEKTAEAFTAANKAGWNPESCEKTAEGFEDVAKKHGLPDAAYNAAVVYAKCGKLDKAEESLNDTMKKFKEHVPTQQRALAYLAYIDLQKKQIPAAEEKLKQAVGLGRNTIEAVPAYTMAATILRDRAMAGDKEAWAKSQTALRTALAIDAKYMPALYQLARLYYGIAVSMKKDSYLTLATLVVDQAKKTDPEFAPIYLVLGQILLQKNQLVEALKAFEKAFQTDPNLYEAYMSFAAINLNFRGYADAKTAFEKAIALRPDSYDAHMGLGVAARGLGDFALARSEYQKASEIDKARTDYIFNLGVLEMDYENPGTPDAYEKAATVFEKFIKHATQEHQIDPDGKKGPELSWVDKANLRIENAKKAAQQIRDAEKQMAELAKLAEEQAKREAEMEKLAKQAEELAKKEAEGAAAATAVDEAAIEKEIAEEEKKKAEEAAKAKEEKEAAEKQAAPQEDAGASESAKEDVKL